MAREIRVRYSCFKRFLSEVSNAKSLLKFPEGCETQVIKSLQKMLDVRLNGILAKELMDAQQNAHVVRNAEKYYRSMVHNSEGSWNIRDQQMIETLWDGPIEVIDIPPGKPGSYEAYFHSVAKRINSNAFFICMKDQLKNSELKEIHGHRADMWPAGV